MPNDCQNELQISGPAIQELLNAIKSDNAVIDFERIVPMPEVLRGTVSGDTTTYGLIALDCASRRQVTETLRHRWIVEAGVHSQEDLKKFLLTTFPDCRAVAERSIAAQKETGFPDWFEWCVAKWGTKWNAYHSCIVEEQDERTTIRFCTAWSPPLPIIEELSSQRPDLALVLNYDDVPGGFSGTFQLRAGKGQWVEYDLEVVVNDCDFTAYRKAQPKFVRIISEVS